MYSLLFKQYITKQYYIWNYTSLLDIHTIYDPPVIDPSETALLILNYKIPFNFDHIWNQAGLRVCADGGANRLYDCLKQFSEDNIENFIPNFICGDMDSARTEVVGFYKKKGNRNNKR